MGFFPPGYGEYGASTTGSGIATTASMAAAGATAGSVVPGAGTVIGAGVGGVAGLVVAIVKGHANRKQAVAQAKKLGIPDAEEVPAFVARCLDWDMSKLKSKRDKFKKLQSGFHPFRSKHRLQAKVAILNALIELKKQGRSKRSISPDIQAAAAVSAEPMAEPLPWIPILLGVGGLSVAALILLTPTSAKKPEGRKEKK